MSSQDRGQPQPTRPSEEHGSREKETASDVERLRESLREVEPQGNTGELPPDD
jgi:hypothetical protein